MNLDKLNKAIEEAQEFIKRAKELRKEQKAHCGYYYGSKLTGAVRRKSMDLTRSLSELRKP